MAYLKTSNNLFLGSPELKFFRESLDDSGFRKFIVQNSASFGLIKNPTNDSPFNNGKIEAGTNAGTIKINSIEAVDKDGLFIVKSLEDNVSISESATQFYWIKIAHTYTQIEEGTVSVDSSGNLTGTGTKFLSKLRGQPNYPSKIKFIGSAGNIQEYEILEVLDDNNAILSGVQFTPESNLQYQVVGTFTPGVPISESLKYPFQYDSCVVSIVAGGTTPPTKTTDKEFYLARVRNNFGVMIIEDKRTEIWGNISSYELKTLPVESNKFIGVEAVKWSDSFSTKDKNIVELAWGLRSTNWTASNSLRQITIANGQGGVFKKDAIIDPFTDGDFNGWRLYFSSGWYAKITESAIDAGAIKVTLDSLIPDNYTALEQIFICPDVEEVGIKCTATDESNTLIEKEIYFPVNTPLARIPLIVSSDTTYLYNIKYRYKNNNIYNKYSILPSDEFYAETSFDEFGELKVNPANWVVKQYTSNETQGYIELVANTDSFSKVIARVDKGDKYGVFFKEFSNVTPLTSLIAGQSDFYQKYQYDGSFTMTVNQIISFSSVAKDGNEFFIFMKGPFIDQSDQYDIEFRQDYVNAGDPGTLLYTVDSASLAKGNIIIFAVFDADNNVWSLERMDESPVIEDIGEVRMFTGSTTGRFDNTGLGISTRWKGWALMNGQNGTVDLRGKFVAGFDPLDSNYTMGATGGSATVVLTEDEIPAHNHGVEGTVHDRNTSGAGGERLYVLPPGTPPDGSTVERNTTITGGGQAHENRPPYYALAFVQKIA